MLITVEVMDGNLMLRFQLPFKRALHFQQQSSPIMYNTMNRRPQAIMERKLLYSRSVNDCKES